MRCREPLEGDMSQAVVGKRQQNVECRRVRVSVVDQSGLTRDFLLLETPTNSRARLYSQSRVSNFW